MKKTKENNPTRHIVLDSYALISFYRKEPSAVRVKLLLTQAQSQKVTLYLSMVNLAEFYYKVIRELGKTHADEVLASVKMLPITLVSATDEIVLRAGQIKAEFPISLADCFAAATALSYNASVLTGDPEFTSLETLVDIIWLENKP